MKHIFFKPLRTPVVALAWLLTGSGAAQAANFAVELSASPDDYSGRCPAVITFNGVIKAAQPGIVQYKLVRSDGVSTPVQTLEFTGPGEQAIKTQWTIGEDSTFRMMSGWETLEIVHPVWLASKKAGFRMTCSPFASSDEPSLTPAPISAPVDCRYGPDTCKQGFVWREARPSDHVCVTPEIRGQTRADNTQVSARRSPTGGAYGPNTCRQGFVWREAFDGDVVCVTPETRAQAARDNRSAPDRRACP